MHLLIIDDEPGVLRALELMLKTYGYQVSAFSDPREAAQFISDDNTIDWIVSDLRMPHLDGLEILTLRNEKTPETPFVLISGHATDKERDQALALGAQAVLKKPFTPDELKAIVEGGVDEKKASQKS